MENESESLKLRNLDIAEYLMTGLPQRDPWIYRGPLMIAALRLHESDVEELASLIDRIVDLSGKFPVHCHPAYGDLILVCAWPELGHSLSTIQKSMGEYLKEVHSNYGQRLTIRSKLFSSGGIRMCGSDAAGYSVIPISVSIHEVTRAALEGSAGSLESN